LDDVSQLPQYKPSFQLNRAIAEKAEAYDFNFLLSMVKLRASADKRVLGSQSGILHSDGGTSRRHRAHPAICVGGGTHPLASPGGRMASTIDDISNGRFGINIVSVESVRVCADGTLAGGLVLRAEIRLRQ
jgi:pyrimidine oxygenase